ncbi:MAG: methyltransferase [Candidatus Thorarchaeota archaeon]
MEMEFFPTLELGLLDGLILLCLWWVIQGLSLLVVPKDVRKRLFEFDRSSWSKRHRVSFATGKLLGLVYLIVAALTPIKIDSIEFLIGLIVYAIGLLGLVVAIQNFANTPLDKPVAIGLYRFSRHPQIVMLFVIGIGLSIALSSWILLLFRIISFGLEHAGVIAEEKECLKRFGDSYKEYLEEVPRYVLI